MSHELEMLADGTASMSYAGEEPWHGLGKKVSNDLSPKEMLVAAGLNWKVQKVPTFARFEKKVNAIEGEVQFLETGNYAIVRETDGKVLSPNVGESWQPIDNEECFEFFADFVKAGKMEMHTAGSLLGGQIIWGLAKIKDKFSLFGGDEIEGHLFLSGSHKYGKVSNTDFTPIRVVCMNTLMMALDVKSKYAVSVNHRTKFDPEVVKLMMGIASDSMDKYKEQATLLGSKSYTGKELREFVSAIFPIGGAKKGSNELSKTANRVLEMVDGQPGSEFAPGTWWSAYNAVTYVVDHELCRTQDARLFNSWLGGGRDKKMDAFELAIKTAVAA